MPTWTDLGDGWSYSEQHGALWLRHACADGQRRTGDASESHDVVSHQPLTLSPSVVCECGTHGFIRDGRWTA